MGGVNVAFFHEIESQRNIMTLILSLIVLVASLNIVSSQLMLIRDKTRGIAILRTVGTSRAAIMRIFIMTGSSIGLVGTGLGSLAGILFAENIETIRRVVEAIIDTEVFDPELYYLTDLPAQIDPVQVLHTLSGAIILSILASLYPAWRAARLDPSETLRYD
jgi:lipoprotein-releasing system permease protein